jgi:hypothetical protein
MKKRVLIYTGCILLLVASFFLYVEKPRYLRLEIPMPQEFPRYAGEYAEREEFSTLVSNLGFGQYHHYFVYRMYVSTSLGEQGFETKNDVENYYDEWLKKLGWKEERAELCDPYMPEFLPNGSYRAYIYPTKYIHKPVACLASWFEFGDGEYLQTSIKTINPSSDVLRDSD